MLWSEGSIPAAIASAKQQNFVFVVVITGEDEQSAQLMSSWEDEKVSEAAQTCCVAIKVDAKSETCVQFSQIYPVVCIPSSFFIGGDGTPLEVIAGSMSAEELTKRISKVKQMQAEQVRGRIIVSPEPEAPAAANPSVSIPTEPALGTTVLPASNPEPTLALPATTEAAPVPGTSKESLSRPLDESGLLGTESPGKDRSASSDDTFHSSHPDETLDAKVDRSSGQLQRPGTNSRSFFDSLCQGHRQEY
ncbi:UBX domain-containing protein 4-like isoform X1 [Lampris incognitus]|uniref:UBX domain-containing protein 4-like isoform X1 n=2 Tax=Lampris incognitus TaxID=2546036 RepID=UPI0024B604AF|nr:UBX domain-containing protein 4-like isoform X1 [Lampris incognitus]